MANFIFISPHFPESYWKFCVALKNKGFNVLGIGDAPYNEIPDECKFALTEYYCCPDMENYENEKRAVQYFISKYGKIDFIESNNEFWLSNDARLREDFKIESGVYPNEAKVFRSKIAQKHCFEKFDIRAARYIEEINKDSLINFSKEVGFPLFAKPDDGVGAQGTFKINNLNDIDVFLNKIDKTRPYIVEEYVDADTISFDGIANDESEVVFATQDVFTTNNADIVNDLMDDMYYCNPYMEEDFKELGKRVVKAVNLRKRFFHIEFFKLKNDHPYLGKKGTFIPLEVNARPAGGYTPDLIDFANSVSCYDIFAETLLNNKNEEDLNGKKFISIAVSRRYNLHYVRPFEECLEKYRDKICMYGEYPQALRDDMGDYFAFAKFDTLEEAYEFDKCLREKIN